MRLSVIIATRDSEASLSALLESLTRQEVSEVIVSDGGSRDNTIAIARQFGADLTRLPFASLGDIWNAGVQLASGDVLWFLRPESRIPAGAANSILDFMESESCIGGTFKVVEENASLVARAEKTVAGILSMGPDFETGLFLLREVIYAADGFLEVEQPLSDIYTRAKKLGKFQKIRGTIVISQQTEK